MVPLLAIFLCLIGYIANGIKRKKDTNIQAQQSSQWGRINHNGPMNITTQQQQQQPSSRMVLYYIYVP